MTEQYRLPCSCGNHLTVETTHAGQNLPCDSCGKTVTVPSFSKVKQLEKSELEARSETTSGSQRSLLQAYAFAAGLILTILGLIAGTGCYFASQYSKRDAPTVNETEVEGYNNFVDNASPTQLYAAWNQHIITDEPGDHVAHFYHAHKVFSDNFLMFAKFGAGVGIAGLFLLLTSFVLPKSKSGRRAR